MEYVKVSPNSVATGGDCPTEEFHISKNCPTLSSLILLSELLKLKTWTYEPRFLEGFLPKTLILPTIMGCRVQK